MKRKKISTKPPAKEKETPAKEEDSFLVGLMKKHGISYEQALKMSIQMDAKKDIFNVSKMNLLHQLTDSENIGTHQLSEGVDTTGKELRVFPDKDQISPENVVEYTNTNGETFDVDKIRKEMSRSSLLSSMIGLPLSGDLDSCRVSDVTSQHPDMLRLKKELAKEKLEKQTYKDALAEKEYQTFQKDRRKAQNGSGSSTTQILWLVVNEYKNAVLESVDKKRIHKEVFWNLKRFKKFRLEMYKEFNKSMFPKERSMADYIRVAETELYHETKNEDFKPTDGRPTNDFKNYIPKYPEDIKPEPPTKRVSINEEDWSRKVRLKLSKHQKMLIMIKIKLTATLLSHKHII